VQYNNGDPVQFFTAFYFMAKIRTAITRLFGAAAVALLLLACVRPLPSEAYTIKISSADDNQACLSCHASRALQDRVAPAMRERFKVGENDLIDSAHGDLACNECHRGKEQIPHTAGGGGVNCGRCHSLEVSSKRGSIYDSLSYSESVHAQARRHGNTKAAVCTSCHGKHDILPVRNPASKVNRGNIPRTCGACHEAIYATYSRSIHGRKWATGNGDTAVCTDCHGEHNIRSPRELASKVSAKNVADTCSKCHAEAKIMKKYGVSVTQPETYRESFHGVANKLGDRVAANCRSCHGDHEILPARDPASTIHPKNLARTCGKCHKNPSANVTRGKIHVLIDRHENPLLFLVSFGFAWLTLGTMVALVGHIFLDLFNRFRRRRKTGS